MKPNENTSVTPNYTLPLIAMVTVFFLFGGLTAMNINVLTPYAKEAFEVTEGQSQIINFAFFIAYFVMSLPASSLVNKIGYKLSVVAGLGVVALGSACYWFSAYTASAAVFLIATFVVASGIAILQVAANPYLAKLGSPDRASMRITIAGAMNSLATTIAPAVGGSLILNETLTVVEREGRVSQTYVLLTILVILVAIVFYLSKLPEIGEVSEEEEEADKEVSSVFDFRNFKFAVGGIFTYVGAEVGVAASMGYYVGKEIDGFSIEQGVKFAAAYWFMAMVGRFLGVPILNAISSQKALTISTLCNIALISGSILLPNDIVIPLFGADIPLVILLLILVGLFNSVMWGCVFALGVDGLGKYTNIASGYLMMAVAGGAVLPFLQGLLGDEIGIKYAYIVPILCYMYLFFYGMNGYKKS